MTEPQPARASASWLALREPADAAARSGALVEELRVRLPGGRAAVVHDLGAGTGSMARWLAHRLPGPQRWVLHDRDADLLLLAVPESLRTADGTPVAVERRCDDVTRLPAARLADAELVTASALLDMMTVAELQRFVTVCVRAGCPVLVVLSVTGEVELDPPDPRDGLVRDAFNDHQRRLVGEDRLLGPDALDAAVGCFAEHGYAVRVRPSPWRLGPAESRLAAAWFEGWLGAALEQRPELGEVAAGYATRRRAEAAAGRLRVTVGHRDLLAVPDRAGGGGHPSA